MIIEKWGVSVKLSDGKFTKNLWKAILVGAIEGLIWCVLVFFAIYAFSDGIIDLIEFMTENTDKVVPIFLAVLPLFVLLGIAIKLLKVDGHKEKRTRTVATKKTTKATTTKKKTTKK